MFSMCSKQKPTQPNFAPTRVVPTPDILGDIPKMMGYTWLYHLIKESLMEETRSYGLSQSHQHKDHCVQWACALRDHEVTLSLAQRSSCPVGTCVRRSWSHILISPEIIVSSGHAPWENMKSHSHQPKDHRVQLAPALGDNEVTFS